MTSINNRALCMSFSVFFSFTISLFAAAQNGTISGKITDKNGAPLAKASVTVKGTGIAAAVDGTVWKTG